MRGSISGQHYARQFKEEYALAVADAGRFSPQALLRLPDASWVVMLESVNRTDLVALYQACAAFGADRFLRDHRNGAERRGRQVLVVQGCHGTVRPLCPGDRTLKIGILRTDRYVASSGADCIAQKGLCFCHNRRTA